MMDKEKSDLDVKWNDRMVSALKGTLGAIPYLGPLVAEIVGIVIPNQRTERIISFVKVLASKIDPEERAKVEAKMLDEKFVDLMEDGFLQAARALSEERIEHIASLLKNSLTDEDLEQNAYKRLLFLLGEINDVEVLILQSYSGNMVQQQEFRKKHHQVVAGPVVHLGSSQEEVDKNAVYETYRTNLIHLGLLRIRFKKPKRGELPEFDEKTGMVEASGYDITFLGRLLLRSIDQSEEV